MRHGKSEWNLENRFTGWVDIGLCDQGITEAIHAADRLKEYQLNELHIFSSALERAIHTKNIIIERNIQIETIHSYQDPALNERNYGTLQGMNKDEAKQIYGAEQIKIWRRSYDIPPPNGESLQMTAARVIPFYLIEIEPLLSSGKNVLVVAHGNTLRALIMHLRNMTPEEILTYEIPTGILIET